MKTTTDYLYAIIDVNGARDPIALSKRALQFGCAALQLRAKTLEDDALLSVARELGSLCKRMGVQFIVNDRPDIASLVGAEGLHLGQEDMAVADARRIVGAIDIGVSTHTLAQAQQAQDDGADRIAFGPIFESSTKANPDPVVGLPALREVCESVSPPVVAIGGITKENAATVLAHGADQVAVISALPTFIG